MALKIYCHAYTTAIQEERCIHQCGICQAMVSNQLHINNPTTYREEQDAKHKRWRRRERIKAGIAIALWAASGIYTIWYIFFK